MNEAIPENFFSAADAALAPHTTDKSFEESLVHSVLFQERSILLERFLFDCNSLFTHARQAKARGHTKALFFQAIEDGVLVPSMREDSADPIARMFTYFDKQYSGLRSPLKNPDGLIFQNNLRSCLSVSLDKGLIRTRDAQFDGEMGAAYANAGRIYLQNDQLPQDVFGPDMRNDPHGRHFKLQQLWQATHAFRHEVLDEALSRSRHDSGLPALSRQEIVNALARHAGAADGDTKHFEFADLVRYAKALPDVYAGMAILAFLKWVIQCYHVAYASQLRATHNFPVYNLDADLIADSMLRTTLDPLPDDADRTVRVDVELPTIDELAGIEPVRLLRARSEQGQDYFYAYGAWAREPSLGNRKRLESSLVKYAEAIPRKSIQKHAAIELKWVGAVAPVLSHLLASANKIDLVTATWINLVAGVVAVIEIPRSGGREGPTNPRTLEVSLDSPMAIVSPPPGRREAVAQN